MHSINLAGKTYIMQVGYEASLGTILLENMVIRNEKKHSHNKVSYNFFRSPTQADQSSRRWHYSSIFFTHIVLFSCFRCGKLENTFVPYNV